MVESESVGRTSRHSDADLEEVGRQIRSYERQVRDYLGKIDANVDAYNFSVEKSGDEIIIELGLRAKIRTKRRTSDLET